MLKPPLKPMLLSRRSKPFNSPDYLFEIKWDGYRCLIFINNNKVYLQSRNQKNLNPYFPELKTITQYLKAANIILDGEICYIDKQGQPNFSALQQYTGFKNNYHRKNNSTKSNTKKNSYSPITFIAWDILSLNDKDIYKLPLLKRKKILSEQVLIEKIQPKKYLPLQPSDYIKEKGKALYERASEEGLEGIVAKKIDSPYEFKRSHYWYKIKIWKYMEVVITGYTPRFSSLYAGIHPDNLNCNKHNINNTKLINLGKVKLALGSSWKKALQQYLPELSINKSPFEQKAGKNSNTKGKNSNVNPSERVTWVKPVLKCRVRYTELTDDCKFRHGYVTELLLDERS